MRLRLDSFKGEVPRLDDAMLPVPAAALARDCDLSTGALRPLRTNAQILEDAAAVDFYLHDGTPLVFPRITSVAPGPVATDRLYIMAEGQDPIMKVMPAGTEYDLGVPYPAFPPTTGIEVAAPEPQPTYLEDEGVPVLDNENNPVIAVDAIPLEVETMVFVYTWVTVYDEESLPSPPAFPLDVTEGSTVRITFADAPPVGSRIDRLRVYRALTAASGTTEYLFIKELNSATAAYVYDANVDLTQEPLPSVYYDPPVSGLMGLTPMHNGMMAAFKGRELYFCEPYQPHAWPATYSLTTDADIVALAAVGEALAVLTTGMPYRCDGTAPENMVMKRIEVSAPCVSALSVVDFGYNAIYATNEGLVTISANGADFLTRNLFTREQWAAMDPVNMVAGRYDGSYVFTYQDGATTRTGIIDLAEQATGFISTDTVASVFRADLESGALLFVDGAGVTEFDPVAGDPRSLTWRTGLINMTSDTTFAVALIEGEALGADAGDTAFAFRVYRDGALIHTVTDLNALRRLPAGLGRSWQFEISGKVRITRAAVAGSVSELMT